MMRELIFTKQVDKSLLKDGLTVPKEQINKLYSVLNVNLKKGDKDEISVLLEGEVYKVRLTHVDYDEKVSTRTVVQIRYSKGHPLCAKLNEIFKHSASTDFTGEKEYLEVYATDDKQLEFVPIPYSGKEIPKTWLLTWNPNHDRWDGFSDAVALTRSGKVYKKEWSCVNTHVQIGDRVYLTMLGTENNGIVASGVAASKCYDADHWDAARAANGEKAHRIDVAFDYIIDYKNEEILKQTTLIETFPQQKWNPQGSGIEIKSIYSKELEKMWDELIQGDEKEVLINKKEALDAIKDYIAAKGFSYSGSLIENFYLSLKSKPFVILAGTSGTGKTRLVKLFAEAIDARYQLVPVRPDWSDSTDLFGHVDLNGRFVPGAILDFIKEAQKNPAKPYFLCLDEMNLARVEYYLSDFLSVIETRDMVNGKIVSASLIDVDKYGADEDARRKYGRIDYPENLYVIGTVNMDETTFPFSKKVLDRANTIEFSYVDLIPDFTAVTADVHQLPLPNLFLRTEHLLLKDCSADAAYITGVCAELQRINEILQKANAHVGYRVRDEIVFYMLGNRCENGETVLPEDEAMDNAIMQKILPRIQGSSASIRDMLCELFKVCGSDHEQKTGDSDAEKMRKVLEDSGIPCRFRRSAEKLQMMVKRFEEDGFTSYWL